MIRTLAIAALFALGACEKAKTEAPKPEFEDNIIVRDDVSQSQAAACYVIGKADAWSNTASPPPLCAPVPECSQGAKRWRSRADGMCYTADIPK